MKKIGNISIGLVVGAALLFWRKLSNVKPALSTTPKPVIKSTPKPVVKPVVKSTPKPIVKPVVKSTIKPIVKPVVKSTPKPVVKPALKGLGLITNAVYRPIKNGNQYDRFFEQPELIDIVLKKNGTPEETIGKITQIIEKTFPQAQKIAKKLQADSIYNTSQNIWNFCFDYLKYTPDDGEELRSPRRAWYDGQVMARQYPQETRSDNQQYGIDCDCYTIFVGSILKCLRIPFQIKMTGYENAFGFVKGFHHVYITVPYNNKNGKKYITIDPVVHSFDYEKPEAIRKVYGIF